MHAEFHANFFANGNKTYAACSSKGLGWRDGEFQERRTTIRNNLTVRVRRNRCLWYFRGLLTAFVYSPMGEPPRGGGSEMAAAVIAHRDVASAHGACN